MNRSNIVSALGTLLIVAAYAASANTVRAGGYIDPGTQNANPLGVGFNVQGGLCGSGCSGFGAAYNGLPGKLPQQIIPLQTPIQPNVQGGWANGQNPYGPGSFNNGMNYPGFNNGYPSYPSPYNGYPMNNGFNNGNRSPCGGGCSSNGNGAFNTGGLTILDMRPKNEWEKNDTAGIVWGVAAGLSSMTSNVYPVAFERQDITLQQPPFSFEGNRQITTIDRLGTQQHGI